MGYKPTLGTFWWSQASAFPMRKKHIDVLANPNMGHQDKMGEF